VSKDKLVVMPGYWFMHNMYALARNAGKYEGRDRRTDKSQVIEYDFLAPDSVNEMFDSLQLMKQFTAKAYAAKNKKITGAKELIKEVETLLETNPSETAKLEIWADSFENSNRKTELVKVSEAYRLFKELIIYYGVTELIHFIGKKKISSWQKLLQALPRNPVRNPWKNNGGQLMPEADVHSLIRNIRSEKINSWDEVHSFYNKKSAVYHNEKFRHAFASLLEVLKISPSRFTKKLFLDLLQQAVSTKEWMVKGIYDSRAKDYSNPFRKMVYETEKEMEKVIGALKDNNFIKEQQAALETYREQANAVLRQFN
jgi:hypothetical protein